MQYTLLYIRKCTAKHAYAHSFTFLLNIFVLLHIDKSVCRDFCCVLKIIVECLSPFYV